MKRIYLLIITVVVTFNTLLGFFNGTIFKSIKRDKAENKEYLLELEEQNLSNIEDEINKYKDKYFKEKSQELEKTEFIESDVSNRKYFENTIFMGDSITEGLSELEVIDEYNVISSKGDTVVKAKKNIEKLVSLNPKNLVIFYGMNDVIEYDGLLSGKDSNMFKNDYIDLVNNIKISLPNTAIFLISPLPVLSKATDTNYRLTNTNLDIFREKVAEVATETESTYVDITSLVMGKDHLYEGDGIHYKYQFYEEWLDYLKMYIKN